MPTLDRLQSASVQAWRGFRSSRAILAISVVTVAVAIGANLAIYGLVDRALFQPPRHLQDPAALHGVAFVREIPNGGTVRMTTTSYVTYRTLRDDVAAIGGAAAWQPGSPSINLDGQQLRAETTLVSSNYFDVLGVQPERGTGLRPGTTDPIIVLSHAFWTRAFRNDPEVLGRRVGFRGRQYAIAGVMPRGFTGHVTGATDAWVPIEAVMSATPGWDSDPYRNIVSVIVRTASSADAAGEASTVLRRPVVLSSIAGSQVSDADRRVAYWLGAVSLLVLLIGLANTATLLAVRGARRRREFVVRFALGASRGRLLSGLALEAVLLASAATAASLVLASLLDDAVRTVLLPGIAPTDGVSPRVLWAALLAGGAVSLTAFTASAVQLPRAARSQDLQRAPYATLQQRALLVIQTAVCVLLLAGAAMFGRSLHQLLSQDFGMAVDEVLIVDFEQGLGQLPGRSDIFESALESVRKLPGVRAATTFEVLPFGGFHVPPIAVPGRAEPPKVGGQLPFLIASTPELHDVLGIRVVDGRGFTAADQAGAPVVVVNESMARGVWPGERAVGKCIRIGFDPTFDPELDSGPPMPSAAVPCREVIGVVRDVRQRSIVPTGNEAALMQYYVPPTQVPPPPGGIDPGPRVNGIAVRTTADARALTPALVRAIVGGRTDLPHVRVQRFSERFDRQLRPWRIGWTLLALFSGLAVLVAGVGLYAAFAHVVAMRRREMAIRLAIGATPRGVGMMVVRDAVLLTAIGTVAGAITAVIGGRSIAAWLYGVRPADPVTIGVTAAIMLALCVIATAWPARTAAMTDPNSLLRAE